MSVKPSWPFLWWGLYGRLDCDVRHTGGAVDTVQRLIFVVLFLFAPIAHSATEQIEATYRWFANASGATGFSSTAQQACDAFGPTHATNQNNAALPAHKTYAYNGVVTAVNNQTSLCQVKNASNVDGSFSVSRQWSCTPFTTWNSGNNEKYWCTVDACVAPQVRQSDGSCGLPSCTPGCNGACGSYKTFKHLQSQACIGSCIYKLGAGLSVSLSTGESSAGHDVRENTGQSCSPDADTPSTPTPCPECECQKQGKSWGTVNGAVVCHTPGTPGTKPVTTQDPPQTKTETPAPTPENPNPEPVTTETPSPVITITPGHGAGSDPTVTETTTNPDGSTTSTSQSQSSYCQQNPTASVCKAADQEEKKGSWSGSCGAFQCEGDAVNCAIARKIHQDRCDDLEDLQQFENAASLGKRLLNGEQDADVTAYLNREGDGNRTINVGSLVSDSGPYSFGASCISDVQFSIGGHYVSVPFSKICPYLEMIGYFLLAAAYLAALRIVGVI